MAGVDDQLDVNYAVEEQASGSITASVGFAQSSGLILGGSISQSNFWAPVITPALGPHPLVVPEQIQHRSTDPDSLPDGVSLGYNALYSKTDYNDYDR